MFGKVKTLTEKGFGFITPDEGGKDVFFHASGLSDIHFNDLRQGEPVEFEIEDSPKGSRAVGVRVLS